MSDAPLVTVVTIFLDAEEFLAEAVASVFAQRFDRWELLLVDDGSSDGSSTYARELAHAHPDRVHYLEHPGHVNRGMSASRNLGLARARGRYIGFLDADDVYLPEKLERQVAMLEANPSAAMVYGPSLHWHSWAGAERAAAPDWTRRLGVIENSLYEPPVLAACYLQGRALTPTTCGMLARRDAVERVGGFETEFRGLYEDQAFFYKMVTSAPVFVSGECLDRYRQHPGSHCRRLRASGAYDPEQPHPARFAFLQWLERYLQQHGIAHADVWQALRREQWSYAHPRLHRLRNGAQLARRFRRLRMRAHRAVQRLFAVELPTRRGS